MMGKNQTVKSLDDINPVMEKAFSVKENKDERSFEDVSDIKQTRSAMRVSDVEFPMLNAVDSGVNVEADVFSNIPIGLSVELGRSQITLKEVFELAEGSIIELERLVGEPLDLVVNGQVIAQGEVVAIDNNYGFRVTNIISNSHK